MTKSLINNNNNNNNTSNVKSNLLASSAGSFLTSIIVTPLDVVKTRLQLQNQIKPPPKSVLSSQFCKRHTKSYYSYFQKKYTFQNTTDAFKKIYKNEGIFTFWRGLAPSILMTVPNAAIYFTSYEYIKENLYKFDNGNNNEAFTLYTVPLIAGSIARMISASVTSPIELLRTNSQGINLSSKVSSISTASAATASATTTTAVTNNSHTTTQSLCRVLGCQSNVCSPLAAYTTSNNSRVLVASTQQRQTFNSLKLFNDIYRNVGIKGLWRGYFPTLIRDIPFSMLYFTSMEVGRVKYMRLQNPNFKIGDKSPFIVNFMAGAISGSFAAALTTPIDVIKTRIQMTAQQNQQNGINNKELKSVKYHFKTILQEEGVYGFTRGMLARVAKVTPACAIMISTFESIKQSNFD